MLHVSCNEKHDVRIFKKASQRYDEIMQKYGLPKGKPEARRIKATEILPSPFNRLGRPLNFPYIHHDMIKNLDNEGFTPSRAQIGMVVRRSNPAKLKRLHDCAHQLIKSHGQLLPSMVIDHTTNKECLGANHLTICVRMYGCGYISPLSKHKCVVSDDADLLLVSQDGHFYYELDDEIPDADCQFLSEMLNSDQNQNQCNSEDHLRNLVYKHVVELVTPEMPHVSTSSIIEHVSKESVVKLRPDNIGDVAQYVVGFHPGPYIQDISRWYAGNVNPRELTISARWMSDIAKAWGKHRPLTKQGATFVHYRGLTVASQTRPNPDVSRTIDNPLIQSLATRDVQNLDDAENIMRGNRELFEKYLDERLSENTATSKFHIYEEAVMRLLCAKSLDVEFNHSVSGKWTTDKARQLQAAWVRHLVSNDSEVKDMIVEFGVGSEDAEEEVQDEVQRRLKDGRADRPIRPTIYKYTMQCLIHVDVYPLINSYLFIDISRNDGSRFRGTHFGNTI